MRRRLFRKLRNTQRIRCIVDGVGFHGTIQHVLTGLVFTRHLKAVAEVLRIMDAELAAGSEISGLARTCTVTDSLADTCVVNVQIDLQ